MSLFENLGRVMAPADALKLKCERCGRTAEWPRTQGFEAFGADASPYEVHKAARCGGCGSREVSVRV